MVVFLCFGEAKTFYMLQNCLKMRVFNELLCKQLFAIRFEQVNSYPTKSCKNAVPPVFRFVFGQYKDIQCNILNKTKQSEAINDQE